MLDLDFVFAVLALCCYEAVRKTTYWRGCQIASEAGSWQQRLSGCGSDEESQMVKW